MTTIRERLVDVRRFFHRLDAAVFTTFRFNADFFEENVLPAVLGVEVESAPARRAEVHERLGEVPVTVYCDPAGIQPSDASYRYTVCPVPVPGAFFHPKAVFLAGEDAAGTPWVYVGVGSANLTLSGWGRNAEVFGETFVCSGIQQPWNAVHQFLEWLERATHALLLDRGTRNGPALVRDTLQRMRSRRLPSGQDQPWAGSSDVRLFFSPVHVGGFPAFLRDGRTRPAEQLIAYSPYWSDVSRGLQAFRARTAELVPAQILGETPRFGLGADEARALPPGTLRRNEREDGARFWHAKIYALRNNGATGALAVGSCNFTAAALGPFGEGRNVEAMLVRRTGPLPAGLPPRVPIGLDALPTVGEPEESAPAPAPIAIVVIYDWATRAYRWWYIRRADHRVVRLELPADGRGAIRLQNGAGQLPEAPPPPRRARFVVRYTVSGEERSWQGLIAEVNLDQSTRTYGSPLSVRDILESWRGKLPSGLGAERGRGDRDEGEDPSQVPDDDPLDALNLYEVYRSCRELATRLRDDLARGDERGARAQLALRPDSTFALAARIVDPPIAASVRFLVLCEVAALFGQFGALVSLPQRAAVRDWLGRARGDLLSDLGAELAAAAPKAAPAEVLAWFEQELAQAWRTA